MGTRSLTKVYEHGKVVVCMYRQFDGYPTGHGAELSEFLNQFAAITNGIAFGETRKTANGMGCLAAQMVGHFKTEAGGFYLYPPAPWTLVRNTFTTYTKTVWSSSRFTHAKNYSMAHWTPSLNSARLLRFNNTVPNSP